MGTDDDLIHNVLSEGSEQSSFACTHCRRQKVKCDRLLPTCGNCKKASRICAYPLTVQKPGPKAGTHRRPRVSMSEAQQDVEVSVKRTKYDTATHGTTDRRTSDASPPTGYEPRKRLASYDLIENGNLNISPRGDLLSHRTPNPLFRIVHPDHEPCDASSQSRLKGSLDAASFEDRFATACANLKVSVGQGWELINTFFANMTAFSLFHRPSFDTKLQFIESVSHLAAFLSPMFAFSLRFVDTTSLAGTDEVSTSQMLETACQLHLGCLAELGDEEPPFYLLQSLVLVAWQKLILGVRGQSWRILGDCIRIAYELKLFIVDVDSVNSDIAIGHDIKAEAWIAYEERRRSWWALWELDIFASTIRRLPALIDDRINLTFLPVHDDDWFAGIESPSCFLAPDATQRWRNLADSGNKSPSAWFILVNSYMFDSHKMGIFPEIWATKMGYKPADTGEVDFSDRRKIIPKMRDFLDNCLRCAQMSLPADLSCENRFLAFRASVSSTAKSTRLMDAGRYSIHLMMQLARIMLYVWDVHYISATQQHPNDIDTPRADVRSNCTSATPGYEVKTERQIWERYLDAAHLIADMIRNTSATHYQFVNPLLANTIWLGAAALVVARLFGPEDSDRRLAASNFDLFVATLNKFETFWGVPSVLKRKLSGLEESIRQIALQSRRESGASEQAADYKLLEKQAQQLQGTRQSTEAMVGLSDEQDRSSALTSGLLSSGNIYAGFNGFDLSSENFNFQDTPGFGAGQNSLMGTNLYDAFFDSLSVPETNMYNVDDQFMYPYQ